MPVDHARDDDRRDSYAVSDLLVQRRRRPQSGAGDVGSGVCIDDRGDKEVHESIGTLQEEERFVVFLWALELGDEAEKRDVARVCKNDICDGQKGVGEGCLHRSIDLALARFLDADGGHGDDHGGENGDEGCDGEITHVAEFARERADVADDQTNDAEDDGAGAVHGDGVHHYGKGQDVRAHYEDEEEELRGAEDLAAPSAHEDFAGVGHVVDEGVGELELADYVARVGCDDTKSEDQNHASGVRLELRIW